MLIKDTQGKYEIKVDKQRRVIYERCIGLLKEEDTQRLHNEYMKKIVPLFNGKSWAKCSDLRNYKTSTVVDAMNTHINWCEQHGLVTGAIIVDQMIVKMQMNRVSKNTVQPTAFKSVEEADKWLKEQGF